MAYLADMLHFILGYIVPFLLVLTLLVFVHEMGHYLAARACNVKVLRFAFGFGKVIWVIFLVLLPYLGVFAYLLTQGGGMAQRNQAQAKEARDQLRSIVGFSAADEIAKLDKLKAAGSITAEEYARLRAKAIG